MWDARSVKDSGQPSAPHPLSASQLHPALPRPQAQCQGSPWDLLIAGVTVEDLVTGGGYGLDDSVMNHACVFHHHQEDVGVEVKCEAARGRSRDVEQ